MYRILQHVPLKQRILRANSAADRQQHLRQLLQGSESAYACKLMLAAVHVAAAMFLNAGQYHSGGVGGGGKAPLGIR